MKVDLPVEIENVASDRVLALYLPSYHDEILQRRQIRLSSLTPRNVVAAMRNNILNGRYIVMFTKRPGRRTEVLISNTGGLRWSVYPIPIWVEKYVVFRYGRNHRGHQACKACKR